MNAIYAHSLPDQLQSEWEPLPDHLERVAASAGVFADTFGVGEWGRLAGVWHDLGKYSTAFQEYLVKSAASAEAGASMNFARVDHSTCGAQHADWRVGRAMGRVLAYCIAGHHGGLPDAVDEQGGESGLVHRLHKTVPPVSAAPPALLNQPKPAPPRLNDDAAGPQVLAFRLSVLTRMLFSALIDADYLATEAFMAPNRAAARARAAPAPLRVLKERLDRHLDDLAKRAVQRADANSVVHGARQEVLNACRQKARLAPGLFSLTVPTGGAKTLSSLAFALEHALRHDLRRVIYAIPFTSIIEQNARVFRDAVETGAEPVVLEHHSAFERPAPDDGAISEPQTPWSDFAAENWDAPLVVTTNVQLFESLFANRTSRCRKLHNIAGSVIILDEVQVLPADVLTPTLAMLRELCRFYGCSVVLCTATQPAFDYRDDFTMGFKRGEELREIVDDPPRLHATLKRTEIVSVGQQTADELVSRLAKHEQVLCIVNTKKAAREMYEGLASTAAAQPYYLSTNLCAAHRFDRFAEIRARLAAGEPCRVVSTQLVEAGVDVDFPVVYRAMAGLDSIHQAAGRCNREGRRRSGQVFVFEYGDTPPGSLTAAVDVGREIATVVDDLQSLGAIERYFEQLFWKRRDELDKEGILKLFDFEGKTGLPHFQFREAAEKYRLIRDDTTPIVVPYSDTGRALVNELRARRFPPDRDFARQLQRYTVSVYERDYRALLDAGVLETCHERYTTLIAPGAYNDELGLTADHPYLDPQELIQ